MFPNNILRVIIALICAGALFFATSCSQSDVITSLEAVVDSLLSGKAVLGVLEGSNRIDPVEAGKVEAILGQAADATGEAVKVMNSGGNVDEDKILRIANLLGGVLAIVGAGTGWGPLVEPIVLGVSSAIKLVLEQLHAPPGVARARVFGSPHKVELRLSAGDKRALGRINQKLSRVRRP